jgi:hypothetical protein
LHRLAPLHPDRRVGLPSQRGQHVAERTSLEPRAVEFGDQIARHDAGLGCGAVRKRPIDPQALRLHRDERLDAEPTSFAVGQALPVARTHRGAEIIHPGKIRERVRARHR